ncbi:hypothetical protein SNE40_022539 [Patella caerulea]|uniref:Uncharacterized protein n=1 Tax=Patella caerulea TaxID=87958 RepID=A0AAN8G0W9_PATCE
MVTAHIYGLNSQKRQKTDDEGYRMGYIFGKRSNLDNDRLLKAFSRQTLTAGEFENLANRDPVIAAIIYRTRSENGDGLVQIDENL